jgi:transcription termination factor Rho
MPVLDQGELERSPLADLHAIAAELGVESFRGLRREDLISAIIDHAGNGESPAGAPEPEAAGASEDTGRRGRTGGGRGGRRPAQGEKPDDGGRPGRRRGGRGRGERSERPERESAARPGSRPDRETEPAEDESEVETEPRRGVLEILPNGSGFLRGESYAPDRGDVHVAPAQIRRCELRSGDMVAGPVRPPRRSERHPSLVRVETVNEAPADPPPERRPFEVLTPAYATERLAAPEELSAVPFGKGSRVAVVDPPGAEAGALLRRLVATLRESHPDLAVIVALAGVRPEDVGLWRQVDGLAVVGGGADGSIDEQSQAAELALERAKRLVEGGSHAVVVVDSLEAVAPDAARRIFAAARRHDEGGSLTVFGTIAVSDELARLATTRIVLEPGTGARGDEPPTVSAASRTVRADLLAG